MGHMYSKIGQVKHFFFEHQRKVTIREIAKELNLGKSTAHRYLKRLITEGIITKDFEPTNTRHYKLVKALHYIENISKSGVIDLLIKELNPSCIILFGSIRKGDSTKESDIDLFIETSIHKDINLKKYEKIIGHKIELLINSNIRNIQINLRNNIYNGIKLHGSFRVNDNNGLE
jgi:predicted nucleotidyltransferase